MREVLIPMKSILSIPVGTLAEATITRARGAEAFQKLRKHIQNHDRLDTVVLVDISGAELVSQSFLDELVIQIGKFDSPNVSIGFRIASDRDLDRLERVCSVRGVRCTYQYGDSPTLRRTHIRKDRELDTRPFQGEFFET